MSKILVILWVCITLTTCYSKDTTAVCWSQYFNAIPCKVKDEKVWLSTTRVWSDEYIISDTFVTEKGEVYLLLISSKKATR